jgi:hypothetical protein
MASTTNSLQALIALCMTSRHGQRNPFLREQQLGLCGKTKVEAQLDRVEVRLCNFEILLRRDHGSLRGVQRKKCALRVETPC